MTIKFLSSIPACVAVYSIYISVIFGDKSCQLLARIWWFSIGTPVSGNSKTGIYYTSLKYSSKWC